MDTSCLEDSDGGDYYLIVLKAPGLVDEVMRELVVLGATRWYVSFSAELHGDGEVEVMARLPAGVEREAKSIPGVKAVSTRPVRQPPSPEACVPHSSGGFALLWRGLRWSVLRTIACVPRLR